MGFGPTTSCIRGKRLTARPQGLHGRDRTTPRLILPWKNFSLQNFQNFFRKYDKIRETLRKTRIWKIIIKSDYKFIPSLRNVRESLVKILRNIWLNCFKICVTTNQWISYYCTITWLKYQIIIYSISIRHQLVVPLHTAAQTITLQSIEGTFPLLPHAILTPCCHTPYKHL